MERINFYIRETSLGPNTIPSARQEPLTVQGTFEELSYFKTVDSFVLK